jgi:hypothetical protein
MAHPEEPVPLRGSTSTGTPIFVLKEWNVPIPRLVVSGAVDAKTGAEIGTIRSEHAAALHLRETPGADASVDRTVAVRTKIFRSFLLTPISPTTSCLATAPGIDFK